MGKPERFQAKDGEWQQWSRKFENYVAACHPGADTALEWATDQKETLSEEAIEDKFGSLADDDEIKRIGDIDNEVYMLLMQFMDGESFDIVSNAPRGRGLEAFRLLARRWDPSTGGRRKNLLRAVLQPGRASMEELSASLEKWEDLVRRYERSRDSHGRAAPLCDDIKQAALEALVPSELERHLQLSSGRLTSYSQTREEVRLFLETRLGHKLKEPRVHGNKKQHDDPMDVDSFAWQNGKGSNKGGKGGKGGKSGKTGKGGQSAKGNGKNGKNDGSRKPAFNGYCNRCKKWGHKEMDCWSKADPTSQNTGKGSKSGKGTGDKQNGKQGAAGSLDGGEDWHQEP